MVGDDRSVELTVGSCDPDAPAFAEHDRDSAEPALGGDQSMAQREVLLGIDVFRQGRRIAVVAPADAIAFEDSTNGVHAAKAAGLFCVVVPNVMTVDLDLTEGDLRLLSLDAMPLREVIKEACPVRKGRAR